MLPGPFSHTYLCVFVTVTVCQHSLPYKRVGPRYEWRDVVGSIYIRTFWGSFIFSNFVFSLPNVWLFDSLNVNPKCPEHFTVQSTIWTNTSVVFFEVVYGVRQGNYYKFYKLKTVVYGWGDPKDPFSGQGFLGLVLYEVL